MHARPRPAFTVLVHDAAAGSGMGGGRAGQWGELVTPTIALPSHAGQPQFLLRDTLATLPAAHTGIVPARYPHLWDHFNRVITAAAPAPGEVEATGAAPLPPSLAAWAGVAPTRRSWLTVRDSSDGEAWSLDGGEAQITIPTSLGRRKVHVDGYVHVGMMARPDVMTTFNDEVAAQAGKNRMKATCERAVTWFRRTLRHMQAAVEDVGSAASASKRRRVEEAPEADAGVVGVTTAPATMAVAGGAGKPAAKAAAHASPSLAPGPTIPLPSGLTVGDLPQLLAYVPIVKEAGLTAAAVKSIVAAATEGNAWFAGAAHAMKEAGATPAPWVVGVSLGGLFMGETAELRRSLLSSTLALVPVEWCRTITGRIPPVAALEAVMMGVDVIDTSYPLWLTQQGYAADWDGVAAGVADAATTAPLDTTTATATLPYIPITDRRIASDMSSLSPTCTCYACRGADPAVMSSWSSGLTPGDAPSAPCRTRGHGRGYIHHLWNTNELLGQVLLQVHNVHQYAMLMARLRHAIMTGTAAQFVTRFTAAFDVGAWERANPAVGGSGVDTKPPGFNVGLKVAGGGGAGTSTAHLVSADATAGAGAVPA